MTTLRQLYRKIIKRTNKTVKTNVILFNNPQRKGVCKKTFTLTPKKPNSALRKIAKVQFSSGKESFVYIPGEGYACKEHDFVLVRGGRVQDIPGIRLKLIRGVLDVVKVKNRMNSKSKY